MSITLSDFINFPFNGGRGIRTDQLAGMIGLDQVVAAIRDGSIILPDETTGLLPDAGLEENQGRIAVSGNHILQSTDHGAVAKDVTFKRYGPDRVVLTGEPARTSQENNYQGAFNAPPDISAYDASDFLWDRGSQIWLFKQNQNDVTWRGFGGPAGFAHGSLYATEALAETHVSEAGKVYIIGQGSGQHVFIVTSYTAATDENWLWDPLGVTLGDVQSAIAAHNTATAAHNDIRSSLSTVEDRLDALDGVEIEAYSSTATYSRGSANSIVTHSNGLFIYISSTTRSSGHDPDTQPGYWLELSEGVAYEVISSGSHRIAARTLVVDGVTDQVYLCTTTQTTPRDLTYIKAQADTIGGTFIELTAMIPTTWKGPHIIGQDYEAGDRVTTNANTRIYTARVDTGETPPHADWIQTGPVGSGGGGSDLEVSDEGTSLTTAATGIDFTGGGVTATESGGTVTVNVPAGGGSGISESDADARYARQSENLGDLDSAATARTNLGLGTAAVQPVGAFLTQDSGDGRYLNEASNLSDLPNAGTARTNLGLGTAATRDTGTAQDNVPILDASGDVDAGIVPIDNTLQVDGSGDLGVNTERVVQTVSEWVQHFASGDGHDTSGHSGKYHEYTSPNTVRRIGSVQYDFDPLNDSAGGGTGKTYQVFVLELSGRNVDAVLGSSAVYSGNSLQHRFHFTDGVLINPNVRIGIGLHRTDGGNNEGLSVRFGTESQNSPRESYDDASEDFNFLGRFNHDRPTPSVNDSVGGTTANQIYGNPEIFYQIIHTHESLVGDGTVSSSHISSGSATADQPLLADGSGGTGFRDPVIHGGNLVDNTIPTAKYGNESVTAGKMSSGAAADGHVATADGSGGVAYEAVSGGSGASLSNATPSAHGIGQSGAAGTSTEASRSDHQHAIPAGVPVATGTANAEGTATTAARSDHVHQQGVFSWGFQVDTLIVPELNQDAISTARIVLEDSGLTHYLTFLDWTAANLDTISHLPVGAHIGLRQGTTTRLLQVEAEWDSTNDRYQVINVNTGILTEAASGTATELLLTAGAGGGTTVVATGFTELRAPATLTVAQTWTATGATIPAADGDEWVRMNGSFDGEVPENFEFLSSRLRTLAEHIVGGSTSTGDVERLQFHDGSVFQRILMARTAANEIILRHEAASQSLGNLSVYSYSSIAADVGTGSFERSTILDAATVSTSAWTEVTLTETLVTGALLEVVAAEDTSGSNSGAFSPAFISSDELLSQATGVSTAPTNGVGAAALKIHSPSGSGGNEFGHDSVRIRLSDEGDKLWVRSARTTGTFNRLSIHKLLPTAVAAGEGGQESPTPEGVAALTPNLVRTTFWKWVLTTDGKPADPTAHWRFDDEWDGTTPFQGGGWYVADDTALDEADNNPAFSQDTWTLWTATEQTRRNVVNDAYTYTDSGYTVTAVWDVQYSFDAITWTTVRPINSTINYIRYRDQETGLWGEIIPVGTNVGNNDWQPIRTNDLVYPAGSNVDFLDAAYDFGDFAELLFIVAGYRSVQVDDGMGGTVAAGANGPWHQFILSRGGGWPTADISESEDNNDANDGSTFQFSYSAAPVGGGLLIWERGDNYVDPGNPPFLQNDGEPPTQLGGHMKIMSTDGDEAHVTGFRFFAFSHQFARTSMSIFARYR